MRDGAQLELLRCEGAEQLAARAAELMEECIRAALAARGVARVALSGGNTPRPAYRALASADLPWAQIEWYWMDERAVAPDSPRSNYAAAREDLIERAEIPANNLHRMRGEDLPAEAAAAYQAELLASFAAEQPFDDAGRSRLRFDLMVAGIGADGHTASLFPGTGAVERSEALVIDVTPGGDLEPRISLTRPALIAARNTLILCVGADKRSALERLLADEGDEDETPARLYRAARGRVTLLLDAAADPRELEDDEPEPESTGSPAEAFDPPTAKAQGRYRKLEASEIIATVARLERRIRERFPEASLAEVCATLHELSKTSQGRIDQITKPNLAMRVAVGVILVAMLAVLWKFTPELHLNYQVQALPELVQTFEATLGSLFFLGTGVAFLVTLENRLKRGRALAIIHELRSLAHIIDMHQLTKDPESVVDMLPKTASSPKRVLTDVELLRYLDYCSEMLALISKVGALYVQGFADPVVLGAVDEVENLTSGLSRKIWQKIMILEQLRAPGASN